MKWISNALQKPDRNGYYVVQLESRANYISPTKTLRIPFHDGFWVYPKKYSELDYKVLSWSK